MNNQNFTYVLEDEEFLQSITNQFKPKQPNEEKEQKKDDFDFSKVDYNNYYVNNGFEHIKRKMKTDLNDPLINILIEESAKNIVTPLEEWNRRNLINNNVKEQKEVSYYTYLT